MAFDSLSEKLQNVFKNLRSKGKLTEDDVKAALKEVNIGLKECSGESNRTGCHEWSQSRTDGHQNRKRRDD